MCSARCLTGEIIALSAMDDLVQPSSSMPSIPGTMHSCQLFFFGDLTISFEEDLRQLLHVKDNAILRSLFERVGFTLRAEVAKLPACQQAWFPRFSTIVDLVSKLRETEGAPALNSALLCLCELGQFIRWVSDNNTSSFSSKLSTNAQIFRRRIESFSKNRQQLPGGTLYRFIRCCCNQYLSNTFRVDSCGY